MLKSCSSFSNWMSAPAHSHYLWLNRPIGTRDDTWKIVNKKVCNTLKERAGKKKNIKQHQVHRPWFSWCGVHSEQRLDGSFARLVLYLYKARLFCLRRWHWLAMKKHQSGSMLSVFFFVFFHVMSPPPLLLSLLDLRRPLWWKKAKQRGVLTLVITAGRRQERTSLPPFFFVVVGAVVDPHWPGLWVRPH